MKALLQDIVFLWREKWGFRVAAVYLACLTLVILIVPILPLPYSPNQLHLDAIFIKPFSSGAHLLGTDQLGRDVLVNTLYGARNGLFIAFPVMLISALLGTTIGSVAGYFGNYKLQTTRASILAGVFSLIIIVYYFIYLPLQSVNFQGTETIRMTALAAGAGLMALVWIVFRPLVLCSSFFKKQVFFPVDSMVLRLIELITSLPKLLILISVAAFATPSVLLLSAIFVATYWTGTARLARAEMLRIKQLPFMEAAISTGMQHSRIILREAIPNLISPVVIAFIFGIGGLLAIESTLSFLGIGLPATFPSWGRTISGIRSNLSAWWLVAFPGGMLAITVLALQTCSYHLVHLTQERARH